jgi:hypothetical protein
MKAIVSIRTDHTNVYGYITVEPFTDNGLPASRDTLPNRVRDLCDTQYPSCMHIQDKDLEVPAQLLKKLGWTVLDEDGDPFFSTERNQQNEI